MSKEVINLCVYVEKQLRDDLKILAIKEGKKLKEVVIDVLTEYVEKQKNENGVF